MTNLQKIGVVLISVSFTVFTLLLTVGEFSLTEKTITTVMGAKPYQADALKNAAIPILDKTYRNQWAFVSDLRKALQIAKEAQEKAANIQNYQATTLPEGVSEWDFRFGDLKGYTLDLTKASTIGITREYSSLFFCLTFLLSIIGAFCYILPLRNEKENIQHNGIWANAMTARGWLGMMVGVWLIVFYIVLYWFPEYLTNWILMVDPISRALNGAGASQWFLYGLLYTVSVGIMGIRMLIKYRGNKYQQIRTLSVIFFQTAFAFLIPEILVRLNQPYYDFKNMFPLKYDFFFEWHLEKLLKGGNLGMFMLVWGIALTLIGVPLFTYFFGKRWYCSWVCGCGGLAETLGDPYRQLSDKSLKAWKIERYLVHGVLAFSVVMTLFVLYTYFTGSSNILFLSSYDVRSWYGFLIGSAFAGVVGTGFYPLMGNRVWCRFGCPLAAYLGLVQRFQSRFRITVNGGQCISCGNCSTYCEMGIDVRAYAQRGQDVVRASCVGCGVCASVCPRGVLKLENGSVDTKNRASQLRTVHVRLEEVGIL